MQKHRRGIVHTLLAGALFALVFAAIRPAITTAGTPSEVLYLGKLTNASGTTAAADGIYQMKFALYNGDSDDADCLWSAGVVLGSDTGCASSAATRKSVSVQVTNGFFSMRLGYSQDATGNSLQAFPTNVFDTTFYNIHLGVTVCGTGSTQLTTTCTESEMEPRKQIAASPFAMRSLNAEQSTGTFTVGSNLGIGGSPTAGLTLASGKDILGTGTASMTGTAIGDAGVSSLPSKIIWTPTKGSFRIGAIGNLSSIAGFANGSTYWDSSNLAAGSLAAGINVKATGAASQAFGLETSAAGLASAAFGMLSVAGDSAADESAFAAGFSARALANSSIALGSTTIASGAESIAIGVSLTASGSNAMAFGKNITASADNTIAIGKDFTNSTADSIKIGADSTPELTITSGTVAVTGALTVNGSAVGSSLSALTAATGTNTINNSSYQQNWRWALSGADPIGMWFTESTASTGTGTPTLISISTLASSTATPLYITNVGDANSFYVGDASADSSPFIIDADGEVGIGTPDPSSALSITKDKDKGATSGTQYPVLNITGSLTAANGQTQDSFYGILSKPQANIGTGTLTNMYGMYIQNMVTGGQSPTIGTMYGLYIANYGGVGGGGGSPTIGTKYALVTETNAGSAVFSDSVAVGFTGAPSYDLSFKKTGATLGMERQTSGAGGTLTVQSGGAQSGASNTNGGDLTLSSGIATGSGTSLISFKTAGNAGSGTSDSSPSTRMTILGNGNVGIGTTNPGADLQVEASDAVTTAFDSEIGIYSNRTFTGTLTQNAGTLWGMQSYVDSQINANGFPVIVGGVKGHVQITANPTGITDIYGTLGSVANPLTSGTLPSIRGLYGTAQHVGAGGTTTTAYGVYGEALEEAGTIGTGYGGYFTSTNATTNVGLYTNASGGTNNYAAILQGGKVGIGSDMASSNNYGLLNVAGKLHLENEFLLDRAAGTTSQYVTFILRESGAAGNFSTGATGQAELYTQDNGSTIGAFAIGNNQSVPLYFITGGTIRQSITGSGDVGIGTITPGEKLEVVGNIISKGTAWTSRTSAVDNSWLSVTYGNGLFVAVSNSGTGNGVMTSPDGINWTSRTSPGDNTWLSVTYGNGLFVAVGPVGTGNRVMTSPDGITWTLRTSAADNNWRSVTYGNGLFVAVAYSGTGNRVMTSPDGITWTLRTSAADNNWYSVTYGNGLFVAVSDTGTGNRVMTSPDGITWTSRTSASDNNWSSVTYGNGLFVAVAYSGTGNRVMTSPDGITWTSRTSAADNSWIGVTYGNGLFVAVGVSGTGNRVMTSPDGITWTSRTSAADNSWRSVIYGNGFFVAVSNSGTGNRVMTSGKAEFNDVSANNIYQGPTIFRNRVTVNATVGSSTAGLCWSGTEGAAQIEDCNGAPSDLAEWYETEAAVAEGDLVALGTQTVNYKGIKRDSANFQKIVEGENESIPVMVKSSSPYQANITGVISTAPYQVLGEDLKKSSKHPLPLALAGRVPVKVSTENGAISPGDYLTSSSTPGAAMKATKAGPTVGMALEGYSGQGVGKVLMLVNLSHSAGTPALATAAPSPAATDSTTPAPAPSSAPSTVTIGVPSFVSGRAELTNALKEVTVTLPSNFAGATAGNYQALITSTGTPAALFIASQTTDSFTVRSMDGISFGPFNWMAVAGTTTAATTEQDITPDAAGAFENIPVTPGALETPDGPLTDALESVPVQTTNDLIPPIAAASFAGFVVSSGIMVRSAGRKKGLKGYLKSFLSLPAVLTKHSAQGFSRIATPNETGIIDNSYTSFARWHFAAQVLLLVGVNLLLVRAILGVALKALA